MNVIRERFEDSDEPGMFVIQMEVRFAADNDDDASDIANEVAAFVNERVVCDLVVAMVREEDAVVIDPFTFDTDELHA